jgi:hypothetical protein
MTFKPDPADLRIHPGVLMDAWTIIDAVHRLRALLRQMPGVSRSPKNSPKLRIFMDRTEIVEELRKHVQLRPLVRAATGRKRFHIARETFAMLDAVFAPGRLVISESGGSVRCVSSSDGSELWRYRPHEGHHVLSLTYRPDDDAVIGVEWPYVHGGSSTMLSWHRMTGACTTRIDLGPDVWHAHGFCQRGTSIVTPTRRVLSTVDGTLRVALA